MSKTQTYRGKKTSGAGPGGGEKGNEKGNEKGDGTKPAVVAQSSDEQLDAETQARYEQAKKSDLTIRNLQKMSMEDLHDLARKEKIEEYTGLKRQDLIFHILKNRIQQQGPMYGPIITVIPADSIASSRSRATATSLSRDSGHSQLNPSTRKT